MKRTSQDDRCARALAMFREVYGRAMALRVLAVRWRARRVRLVARRDRHRGCRCRELAKRLDLDFPLTTASHDVMRAVWGVDD